MPFANARIGLKPHPGVAAVANARIGLKPRSWKKHGSKIIPAEAGSPLCQFRRVSPGGLFPCCICPRIVVLTRSWVPRTRTSVEDDGFNPILGYGERGCWSGTVVSTRFRFARTRTSVEDGVFNLILGHANVGVGRGWCFQPDPGIRECRGGRGIVDRTDFRKRAYGGRRASRS